MNITMSDDGNYVVSLSRAEAHVLIWGGKSSVVASLNWDLRHKLVEIEDALPEDDYTALMQQVDDLPTEPTMPGSNPAAL